MSALSFPYRVGAPRALINMASLYLYLCGDDTTRVFIFLALFVSSLVIDKDNMSASGSNAAVGLPEKLQVEGVDEAVAVIRAWMMHAGGGCELLGKTYDLRKAYAGWPPARKRDS